MTLLRVLLVAVLVLTALLVELTVLAPLGLPGATPPLLLVVVAAVGLAGGEVRGAVTGFVAGLLLDLVPPAQGPIGVSAAVLTAIGYAAGVWGYERERGALLTTGFVALLGGGGVLGTAVLLTVVGDETVTWSSVPLLIGTAVLYAAFLAAFVVPAVGAAVRRLEPARSAYEVGRPER